MQPDILVLRTEHDIPMELRRKVALFCNVELHGCNAVNRCSDYISCTVEYAELDKRNAQCALWGQVYGELLKRVQEDGIYLVSVSPMYTSKECPICGTRRASNRRERLILVQCVEMR